MTMTIEELTEECGRTFDEAFRNLSSLKRQIGRRMPELDKLSENLNAIKRLVFHVDELVPDVIPESFPGHGPLARAGIVSFEELSRELNEHSGLAHLDGIDSALEADILVGLVRKR